MRRFAALVFLVFAACGSIGAQAHTISLAYKAGDTYKYALHTVLDYKIGAEGFAIPFNLEMTGKQTITVKSVDSSGTGAVHMTSKNKYLRDEQVKNVSTAVVQSNIVSNLDLTIDMSAVAGQAGSLLPTGAGAGLQSLSMKGTTTSDVTSWIDTGARRVVKTHSSGSIDATMTLNMAAGATTPGLTGPITFKGTQTTDMNPA